MKYQYDDGGWAAAGFKGETRDCVTRAVAIATGLPYLEVYNRLADGNASQRRTRKGTGGVRSASHGISTSRLWFRNYLQSLGFKWTPTMGIGTGCKVHLRADELPPGRLIVSVSRHMVAVIDGVLHDNHDSTRDGTRCVYGYWSKVS